MNEFMQKLLEEFNGFSTRSKTYTFNGKNVPRVTTIISRCIHNDGLMFWANNLGFRRQSYKETMSIAANIGTECHTNIDAFLENSSHKETDITWQAHNAYQSFLVWYNTLVSKNNVEVIYHEKSLTCPYFGGTLDGLYKINGKTYLIDYKTSNHVTFNYCLQLAAYRYMLREILNIEIDGTIILQLSKTDISYNEFVLNFNDLHHLAFMNDCERAFFSLLYSYYNLSCVEKQFDAINWGDIQ